MASSSSQLKRLKASLRDQGIVGPQKSKKQRQRLARDAGARNERRVHKSVALESIREQFNPFDLKHNVRGPKFPVTTNQPVTKSIKGRPGVSKSLAEERRRQTILVEMQRRHKVGGLSDKRYGEDDPDMDPEEVMAQRFVKEKQRSHKGSVFNLEDEVPIEGLTHGGKALDLNGPILADDFNEADLGPGGDESDGPGQESRNLKRMRPLVEFDDDQDKDGLELDGQDEQDGQPARKKSRKEIMEEVMAKAKMYKAERQADREADKELRSDLDKELPQIQALLMGDHRVSASAHPKTDGMVIAGQQKTEFDREYDLRVRQLTNDQRARPSDRTKTDEEKAQAASERLKRIEDARLKRMAGEPASDDESEASDKEDALPETGIFREEEERFGLGRGIRRRPTATELGLDDEDDFLIDDDLVASGSEVDVANDEEDDDEDVSEVADKESDVDDAIDEGDDEFTKQFLNEEARAQALATERAKPMSTSSSSSEMPAGKDADGVPIWFPCPQSVGQFMEITSPYPIAKLPAVVQRIRAIYHPRLDNKHRENLGQFSTCLVDYISRPPGSVPFDVLETVIRHIHSLAKSYPIEIGKQFRARINEAAKERPLALHTGDLVMLTAVGSIFPTSDHFHQVVTPAMLAIGRFLGQKVPQTLADYATGTYLSILVLQYQRLAKRYVPELINFCLNALVALAPIPADRALGDFPVHEAAPKTRITGSRGVALRKLKFQDCRDEGLTADDASRKIAKIAIANTLVQVLDAVAETWVGKPSFLETFTPAISVLEHMSTGTSRTHLPATLTKQVGRTTAKLQRLVQSARLSRRPLELHHHRPLAIKTFVPKFEDGFDPKKHYDPDRERADMARLRADHKRERKALMRELRRDSEFMVREKLRIKKAKDDAYDRKYNRIVSEIQSEAGKDANEYEREKKARVRSNKRR